MSLKHELDKTPTASLWTTTGSVPKLCISVVILRGLPIDPLAIVSKNTENTPKRN